MKKLPKYTITVPITFYSEVDQEQLDIMLADGVNLFEAQTHLAISSNDPKAIRELPELLSYKEHKQINLNQIYTDTLRKLELAKIKFLSSQQSELSSLIQKLSSQINFYERIKAVEGKECESIIIIY